jgi:hypothetical protein
MYIHIFLVTLVESTTFSAMPIINKQKYVSLTLLFNFAVECIINKVQNDEGLELNGPHQLPDYAHNVKIGQRHEYHETHHCIIK